MKRRGFLGFMGGAAVAGPSMAKAAVAQGMEAMSLQSALGVGGALLGDKEAYYGPTDGPVCATEAGDWDPLADAKRDLARLLGKTVEQIAREKRQLRIHTLDPDIAIMRSISLDSKIRMQRDREWQRNHERERGWIEERIHNILNPPDNLI